MTNAEVQKLTGLSRTEINNYARRFIFWDRIGPGERQARHWTMADVVLLMVIHKLRTEFGIVKPVHLKAACHWLSQYLSMRRLEQLEAEGDWIVLIHALPEMLLASVVDQEDDIVFEGAWSKESKIEAIIVVPLQPIWAEIRERMS